ncbi:MAG: carbohydrate ABC transporter permease [Treponema sp.]|nr:carbohydrate ABC transporter permease [Treponema sp.]
MSTKNMYKDMTIHHYKFRRKPNRSIGGDIGVYIFLAICSFIMVFPLVFAIANSLKPLDEILKFPPDIFPRRPTFDNFSDLFVTLSQGWVPLTRYIWNTLFVTVVGTVGHVFFASMAAYVLAKYRFPGGQAFFRVAVVALMFTGYVTGIPNYLIMCKLHIVDTYWSVILPAIGGSLGLFLMKQFMDGFPMSLIEAAKIDGAQEFTIFWKLVMPNVKPAWLTISIFSIQSLWNNPQTTTIYSESKKMLSYALNQLGTNVIARQGQQNAVIVFTMLVPIVFFIFSQSQIMETMASSGLKD